MRRINYYGCIGELLAGFIGRNLFSLSLVLMERLASPSWKLHICVASFYIHGTYSNKCLCF